MTRVSIDMSKNSIKKQYLDPKNYHHWGQWKQPVLSWSFWEYWCFTKGAIDLHKSTGDSFTPIFIVDGHFYIYRSDFYDKLSGKVFQELSQKNQPLINHIFKDAKRIELLAQKLLETKDKNTQNYLEKAFEIHKQAMFAWVCAAFFDSATNKKILEYNKKYGIPAEEITLQISFENAFEPLSVKDKRQLLLLKEQIMTAGIKKASTIQDIEKIDTRLADKIKKYQKDTEFMGTHHFWGEPRKIQLLLELIFSSEDKSNKKQMKGNLPKEIKSLIETASSASAWRLQLAERVAQIDYSIRPALNVLAKDIGVSYDDLIQLTYDEVLTASRGDHDKTYLKIIEQRKAGFAGIIDNNCSLQVWTGKEYDELLQNFMHDLNQEQQGKSDAIKGTIGNKGIAKGIAAIVLEPKNIARVAKGMILVAPATTPDFLPAMHKAAAFVTDTGGITCHAAIVAREMNKPCIIGTKIATKAIHDGDLIEVDANTGIVKILKRR